MKKLICLLMVVSLVCVANAASIRYMGSGTYDQLATPAVPPATGYTGTGWQSAAVPGAADVARFNWGGNTVTLAYAAPTIQRIQAGVDESGKLVINDGGSLTTTGDSRVGNNNFCTGTLVINTNGVMTNNSWFGVATGNGGVKSSVYGATTGVVEINGGTLNIGQHLWMATGGTHASSGGAPTSMAYMTINAGGVVNVGGNLGLGTIDAVNPSAGLGQAVINVNNGGLLNLHHWDDLNSIQNGSVLNINGSGKVIVGGNRLTAVDNYVAVGKIATEWENGITATYDVATDKTTIVPEPMTMSLLGLGALALLRKKR